MADDELTGQGGDEIFISRENPGSCQRAQSAAHFVGLGSPLVIHACMGPVDGPSSGLCGVLPKDFSLVGDGPFKGDGACRIETDEPRGGRGFGEQCFVLLSFDGDDYPAEGSCDDDPDEECSYGHDGILSSDDGLLAQSMPTKGRMSRMMNESPSRPLIAITSDLMIRKDRPTVFLTMTYVQSVLDAGGIPVILPSTPGDVSGLVAHFDGFILSGGDDPTTESFGAPTHPAAVPVLEDRQRFETQLIGELDKHPEIPVLGICLGMQMLALCRGGVLNQHLPDTHETHAIHWDHEHAIISEDTDRVASGTVWSGHHQAIDDPGELRVVASACDGVIEAVDDPERAFLLGVQWHPERTADHQLGQGIFNRFVQAIS